MKFIQNKENEKMLDKFFQNRFLNILKFFLIIMQANHPSQEVMDLIFRYDQDNQQKKTIENMFPQIIRFLSKNLSFQSTRYK